MYYEYFSESCRAARNLTGPSGTISSAVKKVIMEKNPHHIPLVNKHFKKIETHLRNAVLWWKKVSPIPWATVKGKSLLPQGACSFLQEVPYLGNDSVCRKIALCYQNLSILKICC